MPSAIGTLIDPIPINSWLELEKYIEQNFHELGRWMFRGQENSDWSLTTRLERELEGIPRSTSVSPFPEGLHGEPVVGLRERIELYFVRAFQARAGELMPRVPEGPDTLGWLSVMQHWGFPTRLLDTTASPYVALHFAVAPHARGNGQTLTGAALYAFNSVYLRGLASTQVGAKEHISFSQRDSFHKHFFASSDHLFVAPVHPGEINERMAAQQGSFLVPTSIYEPFERCLTIVVPSVQDVVRKLVLSASAIQEARRRLWRMNIHEASLFPDIHGYARFLSDSIQSFKRSASPNWIVEFGALEHLKFPG